MMHFCRLLAQFHATFWEHEMCKEGWLKAETRGWSAFDGMAEDLRKACAEDFDSGGKGTEAAKRWQVLEETLKKRVDAPQMFEGTQASEVQDVMMLLTGKHYKTLWEGMYRILESRSGRTIIHGDLRAGKVSKLWTLYSI